MEDRETNTYVPITFAFVHSPIDEAFTSIVPTLELPNGKIISDSNNIAE